jgi:hypothetical protein
MRKVNPAAKNANRAFVRLHTYVTKQFDWDLFTKDYRVVLHTDEDGGVTLYIVKVFDKDGQPAALGPKIPTRLRSLTVRLPSCRYGQSSLTTANSVGAMSPAARARRWGMVAWLSA